MVIGAARLLLGMVQHVGRIETGQGAEGAFDLGFRLDLIGHPVAPPRLFGPWLIVFDPRHRSWHGPAVGRTAGRRRPSAGRSPCNRFRDRSARSAQCAALESVAPACTPTGLLNRYEQCRDSTCKKPLKTLPFPWCVSALTLIHHPRNGGRPSDLQTGEEVHGDHRRHRRSSRWC